MKHDTFILRVDPGDIVQVTDFSFIDEWRYVGAVKRKIKIGQADPEGVHTAGYRGETQNMPAFILERTEKDENRPSQYMLADPSVGGPEPIFGSGSAHSFQCQLTWSNRVYAVDANVLEDWLGRRGFTASFFTKEQLEEHFKDA